MRAMLKSSLHDVTTKRVSTFGGDQLKSAVVPWGWTLKQACSFEDANDVATDSVDQ